MNDINAKTEDWDWARAAQPQTAAGATASVKMMLTQADKQALRDLGYSDEAISHMTPDAAAGIISRREAALPSAYTTPEPPPADPGCAMTTLELFDAGLGSRLISGDRARRHNRGQLVAEAREPRQGFGQARPRWMDGLRSEQPEVQVPRPRDSEVMDKLEREYRLRHGRRLRRIRQRRGRRSRPDHRAGMPEGGWPEIALLRRFVRDPNHKRSAFVFRVLDFVGDTATVGNQTLKFKRNGKKTELQVLAPGKQFVIGGMHPELARPTSYHGECRRSATFRSCPPISSIRSSMVCSRR